MKKALGVVFFLCMFSAALFAEFVLEVPTFGYSTTSGNEEVNMNLGPLFGNARLSDEVKMTGNYFMLGLGLGHQPANKNGFYFMWNNNFGVAGKFNMGAKFHLQPVTAMLERADKSGFFYKTDFIFGAALVPIENLYITLGAGASVAINTRSWKFEILGKTPTLKMLGITAGLPLDASVKYYFTKNIGLVFGLNDTLNFSFKHFYEGSLFLNRPSDDIIFAYASFPITIGFENNFSIKIGPTFRF